MVKTSVWALLSVACYRQGRGVQRESESAELSLSTVEHGKVEIGAEILVAISREFGNGIE